MKQGLLARTTYGLEMAGGDSSLLTQNMASRLAVQAAKACSEFAQMGDDGPEQVKLIALFVALAMPEKDRVDLLRMRKEAARAILAAQGRRA